MRRAIFLLAMLAASPAAAGPTETMQVAAQACLSSFQTPENLPSVMKKAGFKVAPGMDPGVYEFSAGGVSGLFEGNPGAFYCTIQSSSVPLKTAQSMVERLVRDMFPAKAIAKGHPERGMRSPCDGLNVMVPRRLGWIHISRRPGIPANA